MFKKTLAFAALATASLLASAQSSPVACGKPSTMSRERKVAGAHSRGQRPIDRHHREVFDPATKPDVKCDKCSDERKGKPILGMQILRGLQATSDKARWDGGEILDPNKGKIYKSRITLIEGGKKLEMRGYIGAPLLGRTQVWIRVE